MTIMRKALLLLDSFFTSLLYIICAAIVTFVMLGVGTWHYEWSKTCAKGVEAKVFRFEFFGIEHDHVMYCSKKTVKNDILSEDFYVMKPGDIKV